MLVEATKENGTTEVWLGTHRNTTIADHVSEGEWESNWIFSSADAVDSPYLTGSRLRCDQT
jgi:hypothetical protein